MQRNKKLQCLQSNLKFLIQKKEDEESEIEDSVLVNIGLGALKDLAQAYHKAEVANGFINMYIDSKVTKEESKRPVKNQKSKDQKG